MEFLKRPFEPGEPHERDDPDDEEHDPDRDAAENTMDDGRDRGVDQRDQQIGLALLFADQQEQPENEIDEKVHEAHEIGKDPEQDRRDRRDDGDDPRREIQLQGGLILHERQERVEGHTLRDRAGGTRIPGIHGRCALPRRRTAGVLRPLPGRVRSGQDRAAARTDGIGLSQGLPAI